MNTKTQDHLIEAVCECGKEKRILTMRKLKNKWPFCECRQAMKVYDEQFMDEQGVGDARGIAKLLRRGRNSHRP